MRPSPSPSFLDTFEAARKGDSAALDELCDRFYPTVRAMVHRSLASDLRLKRPWVSTLFSTGDVVQEVFQSVLRDLGSVHSTSEEAFTGYLARIVRNRLIDAIRFHEAARRDRRLATVSIQEVDVASEGDGPSTKATTADEIAVFLRVLETLPEREKLLLRERMERGETFAELAEVLGYPSADAARKAYYAAQALMLVRLRSAGIADEEQDGPKDSPGEGTA